MNRPWARLLLPVAALALLGGAEPVQAQDTAPGAGRRPIVIAHRGASAERPEHTLAAYERAIDQGADYIEPDLVLTKDGVLVARHENEISGTTDVTDHAAFLSRRTTRTIDGEEVTGWFTEDFTLEELRTLRARERLPDIRPANTRFDGLYAVPTFDEILRLVRAKERETGRAIGIYPETKHPSYFASIGLPHEAPLLATLAAHGYGRREDAVFIQSFESGNLRALKGKAPYRLVQLIAARGAPADRADISYADMTAPMGLAVVRSYADAIGVEKDLVIARGADGLLGRPFRLVEDARRAGLLVHAWTFRPEASFLPAGTPPDEELAAFLNAGLDGVFTDSPAIARAVIGGD